MFNSTEGPLSSKLVPQATTSLLTRIQEKEEFLRNYVSSSSSGDEAAADKLLTVMEELQSAEEELECTRSIKDLTQSRHGRSISHFLQYEEPTFNNTETTFQSLKSRRY